MLRQTWERIISIRARPGSSEIRWLRVFGVFAVIMGIFGMLTIRAVSLYALSADTVIFNYGQAVRGILLILTGGWMIARSPWRASTQAEERRCRIIATIALLLGVMLTAITPADANIWIGQADAIFFWGGIVTLLACVYVLALFGQQGAAGGLLLATFLTYLFGAAAFNEPLTLAALPVASPLLIVIAGLLLRPWIGAVVAFLLPMSLALIRSTVHGSTLEWPGIIVQTGVLLAIAGIVALYARSLEYALTTAERREREVETARTTLAKQNERFQQQQSELHDAQQALEQVVLDQERTIDATVAALQSQSVEIIALQTPVIRVAPQVLVAPLAGAWNRERAAHVTQTVLAQVEQQRARLLVLDLSGATIVGGAVVTLIKQVNNAAQLMGCRCVLTGIAPDLAEELVSVLHELRGIGTAADLAAALASEAKLLRQPTTDDRPPTTG